MPAKPVPPLRPVEIAERLRALSTGLGFSQIGFVALGSAAARAAQQRMIAALDAWLHAGYQGEMTYLQRSRDLRADPTRLLPGARSLILLRMNYLPADMPNDWRVQEQRAARRSGSARIALYARGRDYHKVLRARLRPLVRFIEQQTAARSRICVDSAPLMEVAWAGAAGLGVRGKNTLLLNREAGSMFFLGALITQWDASECAAPAPSGGAPFPLCGSCRACLDACPTGALIAPGKLDARRCLAYLTIEQRSAIAPDLAQRLGNRIFGCDDCQTCCPWNKFAQRSTLPDFTPRAVWSKPLAELAHWSDEKYLRQSAGSPLRRLGSARFRRNLALAQENAARQGSGDE